MRLLLLILAGLAIVPGVGTARTTIAGKVLDAITRSAVADAQVDVGIGLTNKTNLVRTDAAGHFALRLDGWRAKDLDTGRAQLSFTHASYQGMRQWVAFSRNQSQTGLEFKLSPPGGGPIRQSLADSLVRLRDATGHLLAIADLDLDTSGVSLDANQLQKRLMTRLERRIRSYLQERQFPQELCQLSVLRLPDGVDVLQENSARAAGGLLNALAVIGGELRVRSNQSLPTLEITTKFLPIPSVDSLAFSAQTVVDQLSLDPAQPSAITGEAGIVWAQQTAIVLGLREVSEWVATGDRNRLLNARALLLAVQATLPSAEGPLYQWIVNALGFLNRRIS